MRLILAILLVWATAAHAAGPQDGPDAAMLIQEERAGLDIRVPRNVLQDILKNEPI